MHGGVQLGGADVSVFFRGKNRSLSYNDSKAENSAYKARQILGAELRYESDRALRRYADAHRAL